MRMCGCYVRALSSPLSDFYLRIAGGSILVAFVFFYDFHIIIIEIATTQP